MKIQNLKSRPRLHVYNNNVEIFNCGSYLVGFNYCTVVDMLVEENTV